MEGEGPTKIKLEITDPEKLVQYQESEKELKNRALEKARSLKVNVLFCQQPIDNFVKSKLSDMGILAFESTDREDLKAISKATSANLLGNLLEISEHDVGKAEKLETEKISLEKIVTLTGCEGATFLLRGSSPQALDELEALIQNSLTLLHTAKSEGKTVAGGGAIEMHLAKELKVFAKQFPGKEQLAIDAFAQALMEIPKCLASNNGLEVNDTIPELIKLHAEGLNEVGVGQYRCHENVCCDLSEVKSSIIRRAYEVATLMLRIDEQISYKEVAKFHKK
jgi:chaperonin GroEL (HSP60 family)